MPKLHAITHLNLRYILPVVLSELDEQETDFSCERSVLLQLQNSGEEYRLYRQAVKYCFKYFGGLANSANETTYFNDLVISEIKGQFVAKDPNDNVVMSHEILSTLVHNLFSNNYL